MNVKEMMSSGVYFVTDDADASDVLDVMKKYSIGLVPVCDNRGCLLGVITDRDLLLRHTSKPSASPSGCLLDALMTRNVVTVSPDMNIHTAAAIFAKCRLRRLPVVENSRLVGILSLTDLAKKRMFLAEAGEILGAIARDSKGSSR